MASLCNYSQPELQNTSGLERHGSGVLFPYNPEFYERASGLYGPGSVLAWYILLVSFTINWASEVRMHERVPKISADLVAFVTYPVFAATDVLIQAIQLRGFEHRAVALFCLQNPTGILNPSMFSETLFPKTPLHLADVPPEVLELGQRLVDLTGPLEVCYAFSVLVFVCPIICGVATNLAPDKMKPDPRQTRISVLALFGCSAYVCLMVFVFYCSLGDILKSLLMWYFETFNILIKMCAVALGLIMSGATLMSLKSFTLRVLCRGGREEISKTARELGKAFIAGIMASAFYWAGWTLRPGFVADLGITVGERDQLAALLAGGMALIYKLYDLYSNRGQRQDRIEMGLEEGLLSAEEGQDQDPHSLPRLNSM